MFRSTFARVCAGMFGVAALVATAHSAQATLTLVQPDPASSATFVGNAGYSADGLGQSGTGGAVQAEVPAGSTIEMAYLYGTYFDQLPSGAALDIDFDGTTVTLTPLDTTSINLSSARADVTSLVAAKVGSGGAAPTDFAIGSDPANLDGVGLVVIYSNPALPHTTIAVLDGAQATTGDSVTLNFASPLDTSVTGFNAQMSLGIGFGHQGADGSACGGGQYSIVDVNGERLTSCAGNYDDGYGANGGLITVGGVGDSLANPADPLATSGGEDDELYDLLPYLSDGDTSLVIDTTNPSNDDIVFLAVVQIAAEATVTTEVCTDGIDNDGDGLVDGDDPDCQEPPVTPTASDFFSIGGQLGSGPAQTTFGGHLHCSVVAGETNSLQVNWNRGNRFHLTELTGAACSDDPALDEGSPAAGFDTLTGSGSGRYNGEDGASATWVITDAGEPGSDDTVELTIKDADGVVVHTVSGTLRGGNTQAHPADD